MSIQSKVAKNTIIQIIGKISATVFGILTIALMTRYLGAAGFGNYTTAITFASFFAIIADLGLTLVTSRMISDPKNDKQKTLNNLFGLRLVSAILIIGLAPVIIWFFPYPQIVKIATALASLSLIFPALNQIIIGFFQKELTMAKSVWAENLSRLFILIIVYLAITKNLGLNGIMIAMVLGGLLNFILHLLLSGKNLLLRLEFDFKFWQKIWLQSWPLALTIAFNLIYLKADTLILSLTKSATEVGIYGAAYKILDVITAIPFMFCGLILPLLTTAWVNHETEKIKQLMQRALEIMALLSLPLFFGSIPLAKTIIKIIAGNDFLAAGKIMIILMLAAVAIFMGAVPAHAIIALNQQKKMIPFYLLVAITALCGYLYFIPRYSYLGAAWVTVYSEMAIAICAYILSIRLTKLKLRTNKILKSLVAAIIMTLSINTIISIFHVPNPANALQLLALITWGAVSYFFLLYLFGVLHKQEIRDIIKQNPEPLL